MKKWLLYLESLLSGIIGAIIGGLIVLITGLEGFFIDVDIEFLATMIAIMGTILGWLYLLSRLLLKSIHRATNANTAFQRGAPMIKALLYGTDGFFSGIIGTIIGSCLALIAKPEGIVINVNIEFLATMIVILLTISGWYYLLLRMKLEIMQLEDAARQRSGAHR